MLNIRNSEQLFEQEGNSPDGHSESLSAVPDCLPVQDDALPPAPAAPAGEQTGMETAVPPPAGGSVLQDRTQENAPSETGQLQEGEEDPDPETEKAEGGQVLCLIPLSFSEQLRNLRAEAGMTIADVALKVRSSQDFIRKLESGDFYSIRKHDHYCKSFIERICMVYQVAPDELLEKFEQESRAAGRSSEQTGNSSLRNAPPGSSIFADEDLSEDKEESPALHLPAVLIGVLVGLLLVLLISAWIYQKIRARKNVEILQVIETELPSLIKPEKIPLDVLPIPEN